MAGGLREMDVEVRLVGDAQGQRHVQVQADILRAAEIGNGNAESEGGCWVIDRDGKAMLEGVHIETETS